MKTCLEGIEKQRISVKWSPKNPTKIFTNPASKIFFGTSALECFAGGHAGSYRLMDAKDGSQPGRY
jgi:hypothetical protein